MRIIHHHPQNKKASVVDIFNAKLNQEPSADYSSNITTSKFVSDKSLVDELINDQYTACASTVKQWINDDQEKSTENHQQHDENLLKHLDADTCCYIIEFIPTFSKYKSIKHDEEYLKSIKFPHTIVRTNYLRIDPDFVTFHKMRIISKHFNTRMMKKILTIETLFITSNIDPKYLCVLLREQTKYTLFGINSDSLYLYQDVKFVEQESWKKDEFTFENNFSKKEDIKVNIDTLATLGGGLNFEWGTGREHDGIDFKFSFGMQFEQFDLGSESENKVEDFSIETNVSLKENTEPPYYYSPKSITWTDYSSQTSRNSYERLQISDQFLSAFVGENTTIKRLVIVPDMLHQINIVQACKRLKTIVSFHGHQSTFINTQFDSIDHLIIFAMTPIGINFLLESIPAKKVDIYVRSNSTWNTKTNDDNNDILINYNTFSQSYKMIDEQFTCIGPAIWESFIPLIESGYSKELLDYLFIKCNIPIELVCFDTITEANTFQYLIYLSNKYQHGRLFRITSPLGKNSIEDAICLGWNFTNQLKEMPYFHNLSLDIFTIISNFMSNDEFYPFFLNILVRKQSIKLIENKILHMLIENPKQLYQTLSQQYSCTANRNDTNTAISLPLLILVLKNIPSTLDLFLMQMETEDYELFQTLDFEGNTIFHILAMFCQDNPASVPLFLSVLSNFPQVMEKNNYGDSPIEILLSILPEITMPVRLFIKKLKLVVREDLQKLL